MWNQEQAAAKAREKNDTMFAAFRAVGQAKHIPSRVREHSPMRSFPSLSSIYKTSTSISSAVVCPHAVKLLEAFRMRIENLTNNTPEAVGNHPLVAFAADPTGSVPDNTDAWEVWNPSLDTLLQRQFPF